MAQSQGIQAMNSSLPMICVILINIFLVYFVFYVLHITEKHNILAAQVNRLEIILEKVLEMHDKK
jgi:hypothetical protein